MNISQPIAACRRFCAIGIVLTIVCASPVQGAERELDQDPPPGSAREIETPIQRVFPAFSELQSVFPGLKAKLQESPPFFSDTQLEVRLRTAYFEQDRANGILSEAWAAGGSVYYHSGWLGELLAVEAEGFTSQPIYDPDGRGGTGLLTLDQKGYSALGIANAKLRNNGYILTVGRQYLDLPYVNRADSRITPNTFESVTLAKTDGQIQVSTGYTWKIKRRTSEDFVSFTEAVGLDKERGLAHLGLVWDPTEDFHMGLTSGVVPDLFGGIYGELGIGREMANGWLARLDSQFTRQWDVGDDLSGPLFDDAWNLGLRGSASRNGAVFRLGLSVTGPDAGIVSPFGTRPSYVDLMQQSFNRPDETAILASVTYDFSESGLQGLSVISNYVAGFGGKVQGRSGDRQEIDLTVDYRIYEGFLKNLWLRFRGSWLEDDLQESNGTDFRIILRYEVGVL